MKNLGKRMLFVIPLVLTGCQSSETESDMAGNAVRIRIMQVSDTASKTSVRYSGTVEEATGSSLSFPVPGTVVGLKVRPGDKVGKGQLVAEIDPTTLRSAYEAAKASLKQAEDAYERLQKLYEENSLPEIKWVEMQSKLRQAQSMEEMARKNLNDCKLYAPFGGVVSEKFVEIGHNVVPGMPVIKLVAVSHVEVSISVPEADINRVEVGDKAYVSDCGNRGNEMLPGRVVEKGIVANPLTRAYTVKIKLDKQGSLLPGMVTEVMLESQKEGSSSVMIPARLVQVDENNRTFVWLDEKGKAVKQEIVCGDYTADGVAVASGLEQGDKVIVEGQSKVCEGMAVTSVN